MWSALLALALPFVQDVEVFTPAPYPISCPARLGAAELKAKPPNPKVPNLMLSQSDISAGVARGDPWIMLEGQAVCDYAAADWTATLVSSKNPGLGQTRFRQWQGGQVKPVTLSGLAGASPVAPKRPGRLQELYVVKSDADGGVLLLIDYPAAGAPAAAAALKAASDANH